MEPSGVIESSQFPCYNKGTEKYHYIYTITKLTDKYKIHKQSRISLTLHNGDFIEVTESMTDDIVGRIDEGFTGTAGFCIFKGRFSKSIKCTKKH